MPSRLSGVTMDRLRDTTPETIIRLIRNDCEILERAFGKATKYSPAPLFCYKIAIFIDPHFYYHVFRENQNGYWSHFVPGTAGPTQLDSNGQLIRDPEKCVFVNEWGSYSTPDANGSHIKILEGNNCLSMLDVFDLTSFVGYFYTDMVF